jgi:hypothetical protein
MGEELSAGCASPTRGPVGEEPRPETESQGKNAETKTMPTWPSSRCCALPGISCPWIFAVRGAGSNSTVTKPPPVVLHEPAWMSKVPDILRRLYG